MHKAKSAFTLIEMLVVIGVIGILATGMSVVNFGGGGQSIYTAQQVVMGAFFEAKSVALTRHTETRVVIYKGSDGARKLRQIGVLYRVTGDDDQAMGWASLSEGSIIPEGVFIIPPDADFSKHVKLPADANEKDVFKSTFNNGYTGAYSVVGIQEFPSTKPSNVTEGDGDFYAYQFSADGMSMNPGARVMMGVGRIDSKGFYRMESPFSELGFVIRRLGNTIPFSSYDEIDQAYGSGSSDDKVKSDEKDEKKTEDAEKKDSAPTKPAAANSPAENTPANQK